MKLVKKDHIIYMQNAYMAVEDKARTEEAGMVKTDHHNCRLGKWYYEGRGKELFGHTAAFRQLEKPHSLVHENVHKAVALSQGNWESDLALRENMVAAIEAAEDASRQVVGIIDQMVAEKHDG